MSSAAELAWLRAATGVRVVDFYAELGIELRDAGEEAPCSCFANPAHEDRDPSCSVNLLTGLFKCHGCGVQGNAYQAALACGFDERRARELAQSHGVFLEREREKMPTETQLKKWREALRGDERLVRRLYEVKAWTPYAVWRCGLGWDGERLTFPIRDRRLRVCGLVRYLPGGVPKCKALPGSKRLLFPAPETLVRDRPLFIVEGEGDAVSVRSCGHQAVGVGGAKNWRFEFVERLYHFKRIVVLADADAQGRELAAQIRVHIPRARVVDVAPDREDGLDFGDLCVEAARDGGLRQMETWLTNLARQA